MIKKFKFIATAAAAVALLSGAGTSAWAEPVKNIVIVHGAFADGSGWRRVADILGKDRSEERRVGKECS